MWFVYLVDVLSEADFFFGLAAFLLLMAAIIAKGSILYAHIDEDMVTLSSSETFKSFNRTINKIFWFGLVALFFNLAIPNKPTMYTMVAIKAIDVVSETQTAKNLVPKSVKMVELYLDKAIGELQSAGQENAAEIAKNAIDVLKGEDQK